MADIIRIQDFTPEEIQELLANSGSKVTSKQASTLKDLIEDTGGIDQAVVAVDFLHELKKAA